MKYSIETKVYEIKEAEGDAITSPATLFKAVKDDFNPIQEEMYVLSLDVGNRVVSKVLVAKGCLSSVSIDPATIFRNVLMNPTNNFVLAHNHPSGNTTPSQEDIEFTRKIITGAKTLGLTMVDHLVYTSSGYTSFKAVGLL